MYNINLFIMGAAKPIIGFHRLTNIIQLSCTGNIIRSKNEFDLRDWSLITGRGGHKTGGGGM